MDAHIIDIAVAGGRFAAHRLALRIDHKPSDREEVLAQAGARLEHQLPCSQCSAAVIEEARLVMVDAFIAECQARNIDLHRCRT